MRLEQLDQFGEFSVNFLRNVEGEKCATEV